MFIPAWSVLVQLRVIRDVQVIAKLGWVLGCEGDNLATSAKLQAPWGWGWGMEMRDSFPPFHTPPPESLLRRLLAERKCVAVGITFSISLKASNSMWSLNVMGLSNFHKRRAIVCSRKSRSMEKKWIADILFPFR